MPAELVVLGSVALACFATLGIRLHRQRRSTLEVGVFLAMGGLLCSVALIITLPLRFPAQD